MKRKLIIYNVVMTVVVLALMFGFGIMVTNSNNKSITEKKIKDITAVYVANYSDDIAFPSDNDVRVTVIASDGRVIKDNGAEQIEENHLYRDEIKSAALGKPAVVVRHSETLGKEMMYYAETVKDASGNITAFVRVAIPTEDIGAYAIKSVVPMVIILLSVWVCSVIASVLLTNALLKPLKQVKDDLTKIEQGTYQKVKPNTGDKDIDLILTDIGELSEKLNDGKSIRSEFFANASHELKTPLTAIKGFNDMIALQSKEQKILDYSSRIGKEIDRVINLLGDMLDLSKLETSLSDPENIARIELAEIAGEVAEALSHTAAERNITLNIDGSGVVRAEREHIYELVKNLVENGIRYNEPNGRVDITIARENGKTILTVADNGIGIDVKHQSRIFERFYRVDKSRSRATGGTGLGLAIVKHICELYHADLSLSSKLGEGTAVTVVFG